MIIKYIMAILCLVFGANSACGQNIDSLKALLAHGSPSTNNANELTHGVAITF